MSTDPKLRGAKRKKKKPPINRFVKAKLEPENVSFECQQNVDDELVDLNVNNSASEQAGETDTPTCSEKKLSSIYKLYYESESSEQSDSSESEEDSYCEHSLQGNRIINVELLGQTISSQLVCRLCYSDVKMMESQREGLASTFIFSCSNAKCKGLQPFSSSQQIQTSTNLTVNSINRRASLAMRCIGCDHSDLQMFCGMMDMPPPAGKSTHQCITKNIEQASKQAMEDSMKEAGKKEHELAEEIEGDDCRNIDVSCDGTWMTRGHTSKIGAASVIGLQTGKVLGVGTRSTVCKSCDHYDRVDKNSEKYKIWQTDHANSCTKNHKGSAGGMEKEIIKDIFCSSVGDHNLRYTRYIGDGDTNSFKCIHEADPYGKEMQVEKIECVGHVQKRMGTRLRALKRNLGNRKLADGKTIGGRGRLTDAKIDVIQTHYGNAIRGNKNNLEEMRKAVWAVFFHYNSTDAEPTHAFCKVEWCPYRKAVEAGTEDQYKHTSSLPRAVSDKVKPVFKDLANTNLLKKCVDGYTQNANESLNGLIWKYCPKTGNHGLVTVNTSVSIAVAVYNDGASALGQILINLGLSVGKFTTEFMRRKDTLRIENAQRKSKKSSHEERKARRRQRLALEEQQNESEGFPYMAGGH